MRSLSSLLGLAIIGQFALAIFEGTFALYAKTKFNYGPVEVGWVFVVCGLVMAIFQIGATSYFAGRMSEINQIGIGFGLMGVSILLLVMADTKFFVFTFVGLLALGMAFISPNLAVLISKRNGNRHIGAALGVQNAANSLGQTGGLLLGGALFVWQMNAPYLVTGILLIITVIVFWFKLWKPRK